MQQPSYPPQHQQPFYAPNPHAAPVAPVPAPAPSPERKGRRKSNLNVRELLVDKAIDFVLIFVGLYAATAVQKYQDTMKEKAEYVSLLKDFRGELSANLEQEASIAKDLGDINATEPGQNLGPMKKTFDDFFGALDEDDNVVHCLHAEFATAVTPEKSAKGGHGGKNAKCHALYAKFDKAHQESAESFNFSPAVLTPFYRYEVWQLYLADGVKIFRNKELAVKLGEIYSNAKIIERQVAEIEGTYNDAFMKQVGRSAATDAELAEVIHDEETQHGLSPQNQSELLHIAEAIKEERYATKEAKSILELKIERMKKTVLLMRKEIETVSKAIDDELAVVAPGEVARSAGEAKPAEAAK
jgi:hypothetical protein